MTSSKPTKVGSFKSALMLGVNPNAERETNDFYATNPKALKLLLNQLKEDNIILDNNIWECSCGQGHLSKELLRNGYNVTSSDLINRGYGETKDFLKCINAVEGDILTNPPFKLAEDFIEKAMSLLATGNKLILFLKIQFLEGQKRNKLFKRFPPKYVYVHSSRQQCSKNADFEHLHATTQFYAWYIFEKGYMSDTILRWLQPNNKKEDGIPPTNKLVGILPKII